MSGTLGASEREAPSLRLRASAIAAPDGGLLLFAGVCLALAVVIYVLALGADDLLRADANLRFPQIVGDWRLRDDASQAFSRGSGVAFICAGALLLAGSLAGGIGRAGIVAAVVGAGPLAGWALSGLLASTDPVGGEALRATEGAFPSGHATIALSLGLGLVVALPARARILGGIAAVAVAACVAVAVVALGWHYPSDVAGGFLVSLAGAAVVVAIAAPDRPALAGGGSIRSSVALASGAVAVAAAMGVAGLALLPDESAGGFVDAHPRFIAYVATTTLLVVAGVAIFALILGAARRRGQSIKI